MKTAEQIINDISERIVDPEESIGYCDVIYFMEEYAAQFKTDVTDEEIEKHTESVFVLVNILGKLPEDLVSTIKSLYSAGAKDMRDGKIKKII